MPMRERGEMATHLQLALQIIQFGLELKREVGGHGGRSGGGVPQFRGDNAQQEKRSYSNPRNG